VSEKPELKIFSSLKRALEKGNVEKFLSRACAVIKPFLHARAVVILLKGGGKWEYGISSMGNLESEAMDFLIQEKFVQTALNSTKIFSSREALAVPGLPRSYAYAAPIRVNRPQGVIIAFSRNNLHFTAAQKRNFKALSSLLSQFLFCHNARTGESGNGLPDVMLNLSEKIISSPSLEEALSAILKILSYLYPEAFVALRVLEGDVLKIRAAKGPPNWFGLQKDFRIGEGGAGHAALERMPLYIPDVNSDPRFIKFPENARALVKTYFGIPLVYQGILLGVLDLNFQKKTELTREDISFLTIAGHLAAIALQAFLSREEALAKQEELRNTLLGTITSLSLAVEAKDSYTGTHLKDVQEITRKIGSLMGLSSEELEDLQYAAVLHDIGKVGIPDSVLRKPDRLTPEEWQIMKQHSIIGERIISSIPGLANVAKFVRWHHERWDGKGYPDGLKDYEIPVPVRILTVVDAYSAMREKRPYRDSLPREVAVYELKKNAGTQFDPRVVELFLSLFAFEEEK
jgi:HD-GYP domain-containing protein (c-di-GMP phosphodiesterase class II)